VYVPSSSNVTLTLLSLVALSSSGLPSVSQKNPYSLSEVIVGVTPPSSSGEVPVAWNTPPMAVPSNATVSPSVIMISLGPGDRMIACRLKSHPDKISARHSPVRMGRNQLKHFPCRRLFFSILLLAMLTPFGSYQVVEFVGFVEFIGFASPLPMIYSLKHE